MSDTINQNKKLRMEAFGEILILPFFGQGHLFPCVELCKHLSSRSYKISLIIPSHLSSSIPSALHHHPLVEVIEIAASSAPPPPPPGATPGFRQGPGPQNGPFHHHNRDLGQGLESFLSSRSERRGPTRTVFAVIDVMMSWSKEIFLRFDIPTISFFTSGACSAAMEYAAWKARVDDIKPGEIRILPGLPEGMALAYSDLERGPRRPPHTGGNEGPPGADGPEPGPGGMRFGGPPRPGQQPDIGGNEGPPGVDGPGGMRFGGPPRPGQQPQWVNEIEGSIAMLINTSDDLELPFIEYISNQVEKPVWGVGPLLPDQYWKSAGSVIRDREIRSNRKSNYTEDEVIHWLDSKPRGSVIYISFGSEVSPTLEEYAELANALEESNRPFIWVIQPLSGKPGPPPDLMGIKPGSDVPPQGSFYPHGMDKKVGDRGLIIQGWAPQLLILSHPSTGGFLSHCGWNSTVEAIGRGVPFLAWPIRGDQFLDAKLVVCHLKVGYMVSTREDPSEMVRKEHIVQGIEKLMADEEVHKRAAALRAKFEGGFPASSATALDAFSDFISQKTD